jgi:hypothetical protein
LCIEHSLARHVRRSGGSSDRKSRSGGRSGSWSVRFSRCLTITSTIVVVLLFFHFGSSVASPSLEYIEFSIELFHGIFIGQVLNRHYFLADMGGVTGEIVVVVGVHGIHLVVTTSKNGTTRIIKTRLNEP